MSRKIPYTRINVVSFYFRDKFYPRQKPAIRYMCIYMYQIHSNSTTSMCLAAVVLEGIK